MKYLVTGGAGFIGRWVVKHLLDEGHFVVILDDMSNSYESNLEEFTNSKNFKIVIADINDTAKLKTILENKIDVCIHMASSINVQKSIDEPSHTFNIDVKGTFTVLELCRKYNVKFVFVSSCMIYSSAIDLKINELHPTQSSSPYAAAKLAGEKMTEAYYHTYGLPTVILRPFNCFGPYSIHKNLESPVITKYLQESIVGEKIKIYGDGKQTRDFIYVEDCADFIVKAAKNKKAIGQIINAGSGLETSINDLARMIANSDKIEYVKHHHPQSEIMRLISDNTKANTLLDWKPKTTMKEGIAITRQWLKNLVTMS